MIQRGLLGDKTGQGFYKKLKGKSGDESEILTLDLATFEYRARQRATFPLFGDGAKSGRPARARQDSFSKPPIAPGSFIAQLFSDIFHYAAMRVPEISDDLVSIDNAMKWGFGWEMGPFELWDARGVERIVEGWAKEKRPVPPLVEKLRAAGGTVLLPSGRMEPPRSLTARPPAIARCRRGPAWSFCPPSRRAKRK